MPELQFKTLLAKSIPARDAQQDEQEYRKVKGAATFPAGCRNTLSECKAKAIRAASLFARSTGLVNSHSYSATNNRVVELEKMWFLSDHSP